jgi:hypothetical protein
VLRLHQAGEENAVAVIQSPITAKHVERLAAELSLEPAELGLVRERGRGRRAPRVLVVGPRRQLGPEAFTLEEAREDASVEEGAGGVAETDLAEPGGARWGARLLEALAIILVGLGVPLGWLLAVSPSESDPGGVTSGFVSAVAGVAVSYVTIAIAVAFISARTRARSSERRMRAPWQHGAGEWQPRAWTYHRLEEVLIVAALISIVVSAVMFVTIGGFGG